MELPGTHQFTRPHINPSRYYLPGEYLLGDKGFALEPNLITPFWDSEADAPSGSPEFFLRRTFNVALSSERVAIEHVFGIAKERFSGIRCISRRSWRLGQLLIEAACGLHNFLNTRGVYYSSEVTVIEDTPDVMSPEVQQEEASTDSNSARQFRRALADRVVRRISNSQSNLIKFEWFLYKK